MRNTQLKKELKLGFRGTKLLNGNSMENNEIDSYPEYTECIIYYSW